MNTARALPKPTVRGQWKTIFLTAMTVAVGLLTFCGPAESAFELPEGEKITNPIVIGRGIPQKEAYELFDPKIRRNFDLKNLWMRADLRVRPEFRNNVCFDGRIGASGECNGPSIAPNNLTGNANDQFVQQMTIWASATTCHPMSLFIWNSSILAPGAVMDRLSAPEASGTPETLRSTPVGPRLILAGGRSARLECGPATC